MMNNGIAIENIFLSEFFFFLSFSLQINLLISDLLDFTSITKFVYKQSYTY